MKAFFLTLLFMYVTFFPLWPANRSQAHSVEDDMIIFDEDGDVEFIDPDQDGENQKPDMPVTPRRPVEQASDGGNIFFRPDKYDSNREILSRTLGTPRFLLGGSFGPFIGVSDLGGHVGPQFSIGGIYRPFTYFGLGAGFHGFLLLNQGVGFSGYAPAVDLHVFIPLKRKDPLTPEKSWEISLFARGGFISQGVLHDKIKKRAEGALISAGIRVYHWFSTGLKIYGQLEVAVPQWTSFCEERAASRHCDANVSFSGKGFSLSVGAVFVLW